MKKTHLIIEIMNSEGEPDEVIFFHRCPDKEVRWQNYQSNLLPTSGAVETTKILARMSYDSFIGKKFKPVKCSCGLCMDPSEVIFEYFKDKLMGNEKI